MQFTKSWYGLPSPFAEDAGREVDSEANAAGKVRRHHNVSLLRPQGVVPSPAPFIPLMHPQGRRQLDTTGHFFSGSKFRGLTIHAWMQLLLEPSNQISETWLAPEVKLHPMLRACRDNPRVLLLRGRR